MGDSHVHLVSDSESNVFSGAEMMVSPDSYLPLLARDRMGYKVISLTDDFDSERVLIANIEYHKRKITLKYSLNKPPFFNGEGYILWDKK